MRNAAHSAAEAAAGVAFGFVAIAAADTVPDLGWQPAARAAVVAGAVCLVAVLAWLRSRAIRAGQGASGRDPSNRRHGRNQSIHALSRRFRRG